MVFAKGVGSVEKDSGDRRGAETLSDVSWQLV